MSIIKLGDFNFTNNNLDHREQMIRSFICAKAMHRAGSGHSVFCPGRVGPVISGRGPVRALGLSLRFEHRV